jgi:transcriptional regulator with XRE-family HTH domain
MPTNERLRDAMHRAGRSADDIAAELGVDPKTVERWVTQGRSPYPKHRGRLSALLRETERYLWPDALTPQGAAAADESELVRLYPHRNDIPHELWSRLLASATARIDILVYVGMFLMEDPAFVPALREKAAVGARVRLLFGDPLSKEVTRRSLDEGIGRTAIAAKIRNALALVRPLEGVAGIEIRVHGTTLYNSIYRYDDEMIVNPHVYGLTAPHSPALHLRRLSAGDLFGTYAKGFDRVWDAGKPPKW